MKNENENLIWKSKVKWIGILLLGSINLRDSSHNWVSIPNFLSSTRPHSTWFIQNWRRSSAISGSNPWIFALLQKYISQACLKRTSSDSSWLNSNASEKLCPSIGNFRSSAFIIKYKKEPSENKLNSYDNKLNDRHHRTTRTISEIAM